MEKALLFTLRMQGAENRNFILLIERDVIVRNVLAVLIATDNCLVWTCSDKAEADLILASYADSVPVAASSDGALLIELGQSRRALRTVSFSNQLLEQVIQRFAADGWSFKNKPGLPEWADTELTGIRHTLDELCLARASA